MLMFKTMFDGCKISVVQSNHDHEANTNKSKKKKFLKEKVWDV